MAGAGGPLEACALGSEGIRAYLSVRKEQLRAQRDSAKRLRKQIESLELTQRELVKAAAAARRRVTHEAATGGAEGGNRSSEGRASGSEGHFGSGQSSRASSGSDASEALSEAPSDAESAVSWVSSRRGGSCAARESDDGCGVSSLAVPDLLLAAIGQGGVVDADAGTSPPFGCHSARSSEGAESDASYVPYVHRSGGKERGASSHEPESGGRAAADAADDTADEVAALRLQVAALHAALLERDRERESHAISSTRGFPVVE